MCTNRREVLCGGTGDYWIPLGNQRMDLTVSREGNGTMAAVWLWIHWERKTDETIEWMTLIEWEDQEALIGAGLIADSRILSPTRKEKKKDKERKLWWKRGVRPTYPSEKEVARRRICWECKFEINFNVYVHFGKTKQKNKNQELSRKGVLEEKRWKKLLLFAIIENIEGNILIDVL